MASTIFRKTVSKIDNLAEWRIESAGTWAADGIPAAQNAQLTVSSLFNIDIKDHRSRCVSHELLNSFDLILTMEKGHKEALLVEFPHLAGRVYLVTEMVGDQKEIQDPMGGTPFDFRETARELDRILIQGFNTIRQLAEKNAKLKD
jgi:protein-tyrosine-phosphatase